MNIIATEGQLYLDGGVNSPTGRMQLYINNTWNTVGHNGFDTWDAKVACRQLGYTAVKDFYWLNYFFVSMRLNNFRCRGNESSLTACNHDMVNWDRHDVYLHCQNGKRNIITFLQLRVLMLMYVHSLINVHNTKYHKFKLHQ